MREPDRRVSWGDISITVSSRAMRVERLRRDGDNRIRIEEVEAPVGWRQGEGGENRREVSALMFRKTGCEISDK